MNVAPNVEDIERPTQEVGQALQDWNAIMGAVNYVRSRRALAVEGDGWRVCRGQGDDILIVLPGRPK